MVYGYVMERYKGTIVSEKGVNKDTCTRVHEYKNTRVQVYRAQEQGSQQANIVVTHG